MLTEYDKYDRKKKKMTVFNFQKACYLNISMQRRNLNSKKSRKYKFFLKSF